MSISEKEYTTKTKMHNILLVRPKNIYGLQNYPPLGLICTGTALTEAGYKVEIMINDHQADFDEKFLDKASKSLFVGFTTTTAEVQDGIRLARLLRQNFKVPIVWGGWHVTLFPGQMESSQLVDYAVVGEGEGGVLTIAKHFSKLKHNGNGSSISLLDNSHVNNGSDHIHHISTTEVTCDPNKGKLLNVPFISLEDLPSPNYDLVSNIESYIKRPLSDIFGDYYKNEFRWLPYESSRGCPYPCSFCINPVTGNRKYRVKSPKKVAAELAELVTKHRLTHVKIIDDLFFVQIERVREIFEEVAQLDVEFTWDAECRVDHVKKDFMDDDMFRFLVDNGLVQLTFGIESGSLDSLKRMRKGGKAGPEFAITAIEMCAKHGISSRGSFILDIPGDKPEDIFETVKLIRKLRRYPKFACGVHTYRPYPMSELATQLIAEGKFYQPDSLEKWESEESVRQYTDTAIERTWQANWKLSSRIAFYESLESGFWIKPHQLTNPLINWANNVFIKLATFRNKHMFYGLPLDKIIYISFKDYCNKYFTKLHRNLYSNNGNNGENTAEEFAFDAKDELELSTRSV
jgi:radical SAM superfamily enzyme YgiQ (UPF0313 family)